MFKNKKERENRLLSGTERFNMAKHIEKLRHKYPNTVQYIENNLTAYHCFRCHSPVIKEPGSDYPFQCLNCDENLYHFEVRGSKQPVTDAEMAELAERAAEILMLDK